MAITMSFHKGNIWSEQKEVPGSVHVPMVYEKVPVEPVRWEYRVLTVNAWEEDLPDAVQLNELGDQGWLLVGVLEQRATGRRWPDDDEKMTRDYVSRLLEQEATKRSLPVHYYFVRQRIE